MTNRAIAAGVVGTIIDGRLRDLQEHRGLDFPVGDLVSPAIPNAHSGSGLRQRCGYNSASRISQCL